MRQVWQHIVPPECPVCGKAAADVSMEWGPELRYFVEPCGHEIPDPGTEQVQ